MAENKPPQKSAKKSAARTAAPKASAFTPEEIAAMREHAEEMKAARRPSKGASNEDGDAMVRAKLAAMAPEDRALGERLHHIIKSNAPALTPKLWYGMPAYANQDGDVVCFFQDARKFKSRYATFGFSDKAHLDDGPMWPSAFALKDLTSAEEARIAALVKKAVS